MTILAQALVSISFVMLAVWAAKEDWPLLGLFLAVAGLMGGCEVMFGGWA